VATVSRHFQRLSPEREQRVLENLQALAERGSPAMRAIVIAQVRELLPDRSDFAEDEIRQLLRGGAVFRVLQGVQVIPVMAEGVN
jgi:hypothetical protein